MSSESFAAFRNQRSQQLKELAEEHFRHDLNEGDRDALKSAATKVSTYTFVGTFLGLSAGAYLAFRLRQYRARMFQAFRTAEKPTHLKFADGREEAIPDITPLMKPSRLGDFATYTFFAAGGIFFGGEIGLLTGGLSAKRTISKDPAMRQRIENAFRAFRADVLRKQIEDLESGKNETGW